MATATNMPTEAATPQGGDLALLGLMQLVSPALPIGAFAWSQGLESAFELGWVNNEAELAQWIEGVLEDGLSRCELPLLVRLQSAWASSDAEALAQWNDWLHATRETAELSDEDSRLGAALVTLLRNLELLPKPHLIPEDPGYITMFAWVAHQRCVPVRQTLLGSAWAWLENQLAVACKALPLGHTAAQRIIEQLRPALVIASDQALARQDHELGPILPGLALGSALHETQYSRLFRS
ncbi:urease accessory UreF family protein [Marinobacter sp. S0848L]|uniref:urease accessory protein UreF n=1 Tax=Marinobacter sp. S0848L TaxID=2926423 RepID=UPI001FF331B6|nr:urease accessory UreF family protein [Marinobacter sp. S0848L]MCK0104871.1 urease accessory protein UreF [Marinobacter sp. S0848L]